MASISYYQSQISTLNYQNSKNNELIDKLNNEILPLLSKSSEHLLEADKGIKQGYVIDGSTADKGSIKANMNEIKDIMNNIRTVIVPKLKAQISANNKNINMYNALIRSEQNRIAEEQTLNEIEKPGKGNRLEEVS